mgnify:CR=1 FL=1
MFGMVMSVMTRSKRSGFARKASSASGLLTLTVTSYPRDTSISLPREARGSSSSTRRMDPRPAGNGSTFCSSSSPPASIRGFVFRRLFRLGRRWSDGFTLVNSALKTDFPGERSVVVPFILSDEAAARVPTGQSEPAGVHFFCDAAILGQGGIPSVVFGPGDLGLAHKPDEHVKVDELVQAAEIYAALVVALLGSK